MTEDLVELAGVPPADPPPPDPPEPDEASRPPAAGVLEVRSLSEVVARVAAAGVTRFLFRPVWPADAYGVLAAEDKAGKSWAALDAAVAAVAGTSWLGHFPCDVPGPALVFLGEGGERKTLRRLEAVAAAHDRSLADLNRGLRLCFRVPQLTSEAQLREVAAELAAHPARLVVLDPLYLAAGGARGSDLYEMGRTLQGVQQVCQRAGAALLVVTHWNKTGEGKGAKRISGVGPGAWGRVLVSGAVEHRRTELDTASVVDVEWAFAGDEIPDLSVRVRRRVVAADPDDLDSPLRYAVEVLARPQGDPQEARLSPAQRRVLAAVEAAGAEALWVAQVQGAVAGDGQGKPLRTRTVQQALRDLSDLGMVDEADAGPRGAIAYLASRELPSASARSAARSDRADGFRAVEEE